MFDRDEFEKSKRENAALQAADADLQRMTLEFVARSDKYAYGYQWTWLGLPIIQMPADILAVQEIIWQNKPTLIIETGIAWGGSVVLYASMLELIGEGRVVAIDRVLPEKNIKAIKAYKFAPRINLIEGSSLDPAVIAQVKQHVRPNDRVMLMLDSNHTHEHVLGELRAFAPLVTPGQYAVVYDTIVEHIPPSDHRPRPWGHGDNPATALQQYMKETPRFEPDPYVNAKLGPSFTPGGFVVCRG